jgi:hypothetical protein
MKHVLPIWTLAIACFHAPQTSAAAELPDKYANSVCVIESDAGAGTGFIATFKNRPVIVTNQHVVLGQKGLTIKNSQGDQLKPTGGAIAQGADVAILFLSPPLPAGVTPFELSTNANATAKSGDEIVISGNSLGDGTVTHTPGKIKSVGPDRIEHDAPTFSGNSGSPVFHVKSGQVIGVDTESTRSLLKANWSDESSAKKADASVKGDGVRLFAHRFDTEKEWLALDWKASAAIAEQIAKLTDQIQDSVTLLESGNYAEIKDDVMRGQLQRVKEIEEKENVSDADFFNSFIRAIDSSRNSLDFKAKGLLKTAKGFYYGNEAKEMAEATKKVCEGLDVLKSEVELAKSLYAGKYVMPARIKAILYPNGTLFIFD